MTGESVAGRFTLLEELGRGGMGVVWRAEDTLLGRQVAVKQILTPPHLSEAAIAERRARMLREGRAAARLNHPNAVTVYDVLDEADGIYIVMELVRAVSLWELVQREGPLPVGRVARLGLQLLEVLAEAHAAGIVHRDVKPANVLVLPKDRVKLADFGIASLEGDTRLTGTGTLLGSPAYMAPEQVRGLPCTPASDLWSLGTTLYHALEGRDAFEAQTFPAVIARILDGAPPEPVNAGPLEPLLSELLSKDPADRPDAEAVQEVLEAAIRPIGTAAPPPPRPVVPAPSPSEAQSFQAVVRNRAAETVLGALGCGLLPVFFLFLFASMFVVFDKDLDAAIDILKFSVICGPPGLLLAFLVMVFNSRKGSFEVGPRGIALEWLGRSLDYSWERLEAVTLARSEGDGREAVMIRLASNAAGEDSAPPQQMSGTKGVPPWLEEETGWIGLCYLNTVRVAPEAVKQALIAFAGDRWRPSP